MEFRTNPKLIDWISCPALPFSISKFQPFHSANANNAASGNSPSYNLLANASRRSRRVRSRGSEDSMMARAVSNIEEAILMRRSGVISLYRSATILSISGEVSFTWRTHPVWRRHPTSQPSLSDRANQRIRRSACGRRAVASPSPCRVPKQASKESGLRGS